MARQTVGKPSLVFQKGDDHHHNQRERGGEREWSAGDGETGSDGEGEEASDPEDCPLCLEEMDESDCRFIPCPCSYQICRFCWHKIREEGNQKCPACRRTYTDEDVKFLPEVPRTTTTPKKKPSVKQGAKRTPASTAAGSKKTLSEYRVIQRNLVYVIGISARIAHENILKEPEYFGQYGKILKIVVNRRNLTDGVHQSVGNGGMTSSTTTGPSASAYVTFLRKDDAARAISGVDGSVFDGRVLRATYGTTKYCSFYLRGMACTNAGCMYLHEEGECVDSFTKDELTGGKMHLHSYVLDKAEVVGMRQFGVIHGKSVATATGPAAATSPAVPVAALAISKPSTPVTIAEPFTDRTPSSFFERLSKLAARHQDVDDPPEKLETTTTPPGFSTSPPVVQLPPRRSFLMSGGFDPFRPSEEIVTNSANGNTNAAIRPPPPPPIGSPVPSASRFSPGQTQKFLRDQQSLKQPLFSESISSPTAARPLDPPRWLNPAISTTGGSTGSKVEPSVENFFNLFSHGALGPGGDDVAHPATDPQVAPPTTSNNSSATNNTSAWFDPKGKSIFEDPAIMQARLANSSQRLVRPAPSIPSTATAVSAPTTSAVKQESFTTVKTGSFTTPQSKKTKQTTVKGPSMVIQEPVFGGSQNAFSALIQPDVAAAPVPEKKAGLPINKQTKKPATGSPSLASLDPAIITSHRHAAYEPVKQIPSTRPPDPALLAADPTRMDLDQLNALTTQLEAARRAKHAETQQIEAFMRDILKKGWPGSTGGPSTSNNNNNTSSHSNGSKQHQ